MAETEPKNCRPALVPLYQAESLDESDRRENYVSLPELPGYIVRRDSLLPASAVSEETLDKMEAAYKKSSGMSWKQFIAQLRKVEEEAQE